MLENKRWEGVHSPCYLQFRLSLDGRRTPTGVHLRPPGEVGWCIVNRSREVGFPLLEESLDAFFLVPVQCQCGRNYAPHRGDKTYGPANI